MSARALAFFLYIAFVGCHDERGPESIPLAAYSDSSIASVPQIRTVAELERDARRRCLVLFIDVEWSVTAVRSREVITRLNSTINADNRLSHVELRRIDCTDQNSPFADAFDEWLARQNANPNLISGGYGGVVWVRSGEVVDSVPSAVESGFDVILSRTVELFPNRIEK